MATHASVSEVISKVFNRKNGNNVASWVTQGRVRSLPSATTRSGLYRPPSQSPKVSVKLGAPDYFTQPLYNSPFWDTLKPPSPLPVNPWFILVRAKIQSGRLSIPSQKDV